MREADDKEPIFVSVETSNCLCLPELLSDKSVRGERSKQRPCFSSLLLPSAPPSTLVVTSYRCSPAINIQARQGHPSHSEDSLDITHHTSPHHNVQAGKQASPV